jgi:ion channel-forming bestrophin family protein
MPISIHTRQVLALYLCIIPFAMVNLVWWAVPIVSMLAFTFYGIEAIGDQLENPFGYDRNDIKMDAIIEDARKEMMVLLDQWRNGERTMFTGT